MPYAIYNVGENLWADISLKNLIEFAVSENVTDVLLWQLKNLLFRFQLV